MKRKLLFSVLTVILLISTFPFSASAASANVTATLDMAALNEHASGNGYSWDNSDYIFKMNGLNLVTSDEFGIKLPAGSTVELKGDNYITANRFGIHSFGSITFTGSGTLTITVSDIGIKAAGSLERDTVIFRSGKVIIKNSATGIFAENASMTFSGADIDIKATVNSVYGKNIQFVGGSINLESPVKARGTVEINAVDLTVSAASSAIVADKGIKINEEKIEVGNALSSLSSSDKYNGENAVKLVSTAKQVTKGNLYGGKLPVFFDYLTFALILIAAAAVIAVPIIIKKKKTDKLIAESKLNTKSSKK